MRHQVQAPNGDVVFVDVPSPVIRAQLSRSARDRAALVRDFRREYYTKFRRPPSGGEIMSMLRGVRSS